MPHLLDLTTTPRETFSQIRDQYRAMDEDDLSLELVALGETIANLKAGLADGSYNAATQASLNFNQAKAKIAHQVLYRRQRGNEEREAALKQANFERQKAFEEAAAIRKAERIQQSNTSHERYTRAFIEEAKRLLKPATYTRIHETALTIALTTNPNADHQTHQAQEAQSR